MTKDNELDIKVMFLSLQQEGIVEVKIDYSGGGDSGAIDEVRFQDSEHNDVNVADNVEEAFESFGYHILDQYYGYDWYNNDGGYGQIIIDVIEQSWKIDGYINVQSTEHADEEGYLIDVIESYTKK